jgi:putative membrane protein
LLQANERTLLAWLRTGISLITFGFVIAKLAVWLELSSDPSRRIPGAPWVGGLFVVIGTVADVVGIWRYVALRRALLHAAPAPTASPVVLGLAVGITIIGALLGALVVDSVF